jgi:DnaJ-class molecular chaperone
MMPEILSAEEMEYLLHGKRVVCPRCNGEGWLEPIGPCADGSYITSRPCPKCRGNGLVSEPD